MPMYPSGHSNPGVAAIIFLLDDWLNAMESGTAELRLPDPEYRRAGGRPLWTEEELDTIIRDIDAEIDQLSVRALPYGVVQPGALPTTTSSGIRSAYARCIRL